MYVGNSITQIRKIIKLQTFQNAKLFPAKKVGQNDARQAREKRGATEITAMGGKVSTKGPGCSMCTGRGRFYAQKSSQVRL